MDIHVLPVGSLQANCYLVVGDGPALLVDCGDDADAIRTFVAEHAPDGVGAIVTTHRHHDHIGALAALAADTGAPCFAGGPDVDAIEEATGVRCRGVWDGDVVRAGSVEATVVGLVGHTPGGIALSLPGVLLTGDSLFPGGVGKTTRATFEQLLGDVEVKLFDAYADAVRVLPGHGDPTMLGAERPHLDEWRARGW